MDDLIMTTITPTTTLVPTTITTTTTENFFYIEKLLNDLQLDTVNTTAAYSTKVQLKLYDVLIPLFGTFIILFNLAVVVSSGLILKKGKQPRSTYLFMGNVALSDLLTGFAVLCNEVYPKHYRDEQSCSIQLGTIVSTTITSIYSVGLIGIDRYLYIVYGLQYQKYIFPNRARLLIGLTWILGLFVGFLPAFGWRSDKTDNGRICWFVLLAPPELVLLTTIIGFLPILLVIVLYSIILYHALRKVIQLRQATEDQSGAKTGDLRIFRGGSRIGSTAVLNQQSHMSETETSLQSKTNKFLRFFSRKAKSTEKSNVNVKQTTGKSPTKWKAIKVVMFTTGSFVFTWVPYFIASTLYVYCDPIKNKDFCIGLRLAIASPLAILGFMNSLLNPFIYAWWHNGFRQSVKKMYNGLLFCKKNDMNNIQENSGKHKNISPTIITTTTSIESENENYNSDIERKCVADIHLTPV